jgi:hypothetical protein
VIPSSIKEIEGFYGFSGIEIIEFESGSCVREIRGFFCCKSLRRIEIPASAEIVNGFHSCDSLTEVIFESDSRIREIRGFDWCKLLDRIVIPASAEFISGFNFCSSLAFVRFENVSRVREVDGFTADCCLRAIVGFFGCLIGSIEIPASVENFHGFDDSSLSQLIIAKGTQIKAIKAQNFNRKQGFHAPRLFVVYAEEDLMKSRRRLNMKKSF